MKLKEHKVSEKSKVKKVDEVSNVTKEGNSWNKVSEQK